MQSAPEVFAGTTFHFIGTGKTADDANGYNIKPLAEKYGLWNSVVFEYPQRIPYLDVLQHLHAADAVFILGSTEPHYTPSKMYQGILSEKPVLAILHTQSTAVKVLEESNGGMVFTFNGADDVDKLRIHFAEVFIQFKSFEQSFNAGQVNKEAFNEYSAFSVTKQLSHLLNKIVS